MKMKAPTQAEFNASYSELSGLFRRFCEKCPNHKQGCYSRYCRLGYRYPFQCSQDIDVGDDPELLSLSK